MAIDMDAQKIQFSWDNFLGNLQRSFQDLYRDPEFADVTLLSDDLVSIQSHRVILSSSSPLLNKILSFNNPVLYLKGVRNEELKPLLEFIYTGSVKIEENNVHNFMKTAKDLQIKGLSSKQVKELTQVIQHEEEEQDSSDNQVSQDKNNELIAPLPTQPVFSNDKINRSDNQLETTPQQKKYQCIHCDYITNFKHALKRHAAARHKPEVFSCVECDYETTEGPYLEIHKSYFHGELKQEESDKSTDSNFDLVSDQLDKLLEESDEDNNTQDEENITNESLSEETMKSKDCPKLDSKQCPGCEKEFSSKYTMVNHFKSVHLGHKYSCQLCEAKYSSKQRLTQHMKDAFVHTGQRQSCTHCNATYSTQETLKRHVKAKHGV